MSKPAIPQGTRDFSPADVGRRRFILDTLKEIFELYGFQPVETPAMENLQTLTGKYGDEGDRLIFKVLNNGLHEKKPDDKQRILADMQSMLDRPVAALSVTERALRYDLTIPFARYVVMHQQDIAFPFRRYQMQPVWRADRPQKGRYREFWQCDADVVGSTSLVNEAELICIYREAFHRLNIPLITVKVNSRKLLAALAEICGMPEKMTDITIALDKLDKIGWEGVEADLAARGIGSDAVQQIRDIAEVQGTNGEKLEKIRTQMGESAVGRAGIAEVTETLATHQRMASPHWQSNVQFDVTLARGLNYYTGIIAEVTTGAVKMGSIGGGGRYDDLTGLFGLKDLSGVGISFGIDRIFDVLDELHLFPDAAAAGANVLMTNFGGENEIYAIGVVQTLRANGIAVEFYPDATKIEKQMKFANKRGLKYVLIAGDNERADHKISMKNLQTGVQQLSDIDECSTILKNEQTKINAL